MPLSLLVKQFKSDTATSEAVKETPLIQQVFLPKVDQTRLEGLIVLICYCHPFRA